MSISDIRPLESEPFVLELGFFGTFPFGLEVMPLLELPPEEIKPY